MSPIDASIYGHQQPQPFNNPFEQLMKMRALQQNQQLVQQQIRSGEATEEQRRYALSDKMKTEAEQSALAEILSNPTISQEDAKKQIAARAPGLYPAYIKAFDEHSEKASQIAQNLASAASSLSKAHQNAQEFVANDAADTLAKPEPLHAGILNQKLQTYESLFPESKAKFEEIRQQIASGANPTEILKGLQQASTAQRGANTAEARQTTEQPGQAAQAEMLQKQASGMSPAGISAEQQVTNAQGAQRIGLEQQRVGLERQRLSQEDTAITLTPEAMKMVAHQFAMTGQLPPMGMGKAGAAVRTAIINEAADIYKGLDLPSQVAAFKANQESLKKMQGQRDAVGAFEETALKNLDQFLGAAKKVVDTKSPWLNKPLRALAGQVLGSADQAAFNAARQAVIPEFAKLLSNPSLSGQLTDSQRKEVDTILSPNATLAQIYASANVLKQDAENRKTALDDGIKAIQERIAKPPAGTTASAAAGTMKIRKVGDPSKVAQGPRGPVPAGWEEVP